MTTSVNDDTYIPVGSDKGSSTSTFDTSAAQLSVTNHRFKRELEETSLVISLGCYISIVLVLFAVAIAIVVFVVSTTVSSDKRAFILTLIGGGTLGILTILVLSRKHYKTLLIFTPLATFLAGLLIGFSIFSV